MFLFRFQDMFDLFQSFAHFDSISTIGKLSRLNNPHIKLLGIFSLFWSLMVMPQKLEIAFIIKPILNMESERKVIENIISLLLIIQSHCFEQSLLISNHIIIYQMIMHLLATNLRDCFYYFCEFYFLAWTINRNRSIFIHLFLLLSLSQG